MLSVMGNIAVLSTDDKLNNVILEGCVEFDDEFIPIYLRDKTKIVQFLNYELPEIIIINHGDRYINVEKVLEEIKNDPWLHYGGFIVVHDQEDEQELLKDLAGINIISLLPLNNMKGSFPRLLRILSQNRGILFQRDLHALLQANLSGSFVLDNDPFDLVTYSNLLANFLYNSNLVNHEQKVCFYVALMELLMNAIEHGNCKISYEEKSEYLNQGGDILDLIRKKCQDPEVDKKKVYLNYRINPKKSIIRIRDEGEGFNWKKQVPPTGEEGTKEMHGRGIFMARLYLSKVSFNAKGNEVSLEMEHLHHESNVIPEVLADQEELTFEDQDVVFSQGEKSSYLYYIVSGTFDIIASGRKVASLNPDDIFIGEMSFLLNNRRSATVRCQGSGSLIKISKEAFINAVKRKPHYGIFLARLLAARLVKLHKATT